MSAKSINFVKNPDDDAASDSELLLKLNFELELATLCLYGSYFKFLVTVIL